MPEIRPSIYVPQPVNQELQLPVAFPPLPRVMVERFGKDAQAYEEAMQTFWTRTRRVLADLRFDITAPVNKVVKETKTVVEHMEEFDEGLIIVTDKVSLGAAAILIEKQLREDGDDNLSGMYTLRVVAGSVVTGMTITSATGPGAEISEIIFQTNVLKVQTATGPIITLLKVATTGLVFGADVSSDNFVSGLGGTGWRLGRNTGILECNNGLFRGAIVATSGSIGGFTINANNLEAQTTGNYVVMNSNPSLGFIVGGWAGGAPTGAYAQLSRFSGAYPSLKMDNGAGLTAYLSPDGLDMAGGGNTITIRNDTIGWNSDTILFRLSSNVLSMSGGSTFRAGSFNAFSSIRFKENVRPIDNALELIARLQGCRFDWKNGYALNDIGFIAEDVDPILPTLVGHDGLGRIDSLNYGRLTAVLVEAVKELERRVYGLEHHIPRG
jgi:hypothetical protein